MSKELNHYGVKGMRWGVRRNKTSANILRRKNRRGDSNASSRHSKVKKIESFLKKEIDILKVHPMDGGGLSPKFDVKKIPGIKIDGQQEFPKILGEIRNMKVSDLGKRKGGF